MGQLSHRVDIPFPLFDADNHLYETKDAFTRHLPDRYKGAIDYVDVRFGERFFVKGQPSRGASRKGGG